MQISCLFPKSLSVAEPKDICTINCEQKDGSTQLQHQLKSFLRSAFALSPPLSQLKAPVQLQRSIPPWNFACRLLEKIIWMQNVTRKDYHGKQTCNGPERMDRWDLSEGVTQLTILKRLQKPLGKGIALNSRFFYQVGFFSTGNIRAVGNDEIAQRPMLGFRRKRLLVQAIYPLAWKSCHQTSSGKVPYPVLYSLFSLAGQFCF